MDKKKFRKVGIRIGTKNVVFSKIKKDDATGVEYDEVISAPGVVEVVLTYNVTNEPVAGDDNPVYEQLNSLDTIDVSVTVNSLGKDGEAFLLGREIDENGVLITGSSDIAPDVAMGFESARSDKSNDDIWLLKGQFRPSDETFRTKEKGKINWQQPKLTGTFGPRIFDSNLKISVNTEDDDVDAEFLKSFFDAVPEIAPKAAGGGTP